MKQNYLILFLYCVCNCPDLFSQKPYCEGFHYYQNSSIGNYNANSYVIALEQVRIRENQTILFNQLGDGYSGNLNCGEEYRLANNTSNSVVLYTGGTYSIDASSSTAYSYYASFGAFIDFNNDKDFIDAGEYLGSWQDAYNGKFKQSLLKSKDIQIPCNATLGQNRLRIVCNYYGYPMNASYGCTSCSGAPFYGETMDICINISKPQLFKADFTLPSKDIWVKNAYLFSSTNSGSYYKHKWDLENDGSIEQNSSQSEFTNPRLQWSAQGYHCLKLNSSICNYSDSIIKCFTVKMPMASPQADFIASSVNVPQYEVLSIFDLSDYGPYQWEWDVYDSTTYAGTGFYPSLTGGEVLADPYGNGQNQYSKNPQFTFDYPGCYTVVMTSLNDVGPSPPAIKKCYINVTYPNDFKLGYGTYGPLSDNRVESLNGIISDNGGPHLPYDNLQGMGSRSYLCISPCNAKKITLTLQQLKFSDAGDVLSIWDGKEPGGPGNTLLGKYSKGSVKTAKLNAYSGNMFILFESDGNGIDSGFLGHYSVETGNGNQIIPDFKLQFDSVYQGVPVKFINTTQSVSGVPIWKWSIDQVAVSSHPNEFQTVFNDLNQHEVCLEMTSCSGKQNYCQILNALVPTTQMPLDFKISNIRPKANTDLVVLTPVSSNANTFSWNISPGTYQLMNPPANSLQYGPGFINYNSLPGDSIPTPIIKFTDGNCYSITLQAYNSNNKTNTTSVKSKPNALCALNYCETNVYALAESVGINRVSISDNHKTYLENTSLSGKTAYNDYSETPSDDLYYCHPYNLEIQRNLSKDPVNLNVYFDWNSDGDFNDADESVFISGSSYSKVFQTSFTVPSAANAFSGMVRMRVIMNYDNETTAVCGPNTSGETEDYNLYLTRDLSPPTIALKGKLYNVIKMTHSFVDSGVEVLDNLEGDISNRVEVSSDLDIQVPGMYKINYRACDCSENCVETERYVNVIQNIEIPTLELNPDQGTCIEARRDNSDYTDPGANAFTFNPPQNLNNLIVIEGKVNTRRVGDYTIKYSISNMIGEKVEKTRNVCVRDQIPPTLSSPIDTNVQIGQIWQDPVEVFDAYDNYPVVDLVWQNNKALNNLVKDIYTVTYLARDSSGNKTEPMTIHFRVDDFIPPEIQLNSTTIVEHPVRTFYEPAPASVHDNFYPRQMISFRMIYSDVNPDVLGSYKEVYEAVDGSGNRSYASRTVLVVDKESPKIWGESIHGCVGENIWPYWNLKISDNYYSPEELRPLVEMVNQNVNIWEEGIYTIVFRITDPSGNQSLDFTRYVDFRYFPNCTNSTVDIDEHHIHSSVTVSPNPGNGWFKIQSSIPMEAATCELFDAQGKLLATYDFNGITGELNLSHLPAGVYQLKIRDKENTYNTRLVIVY